MKMLGLTNIMKGNAEAHCGKCAPGGKRPLRHRSRQVEKRQWRRDPENARYQ